MRPAAWATLQALQRGCMQVGCPSAAFPAPPCCLCLLEPAGISPLPRAFVEAFFLMRVAEPCGALPVLQLLSLSALEVTCRWLLRLRCTA